MVFVTDEMASRFSRGDQVTEVLLETAVPDEILEFAIDGAERRDFVWVGMLEGWKAWELAVESFSEAFASEEAGPTLKMIGVGRDMERARERTKALGISEQVEFVGKLPREGVWDAMVRARGLFFSSIRDTSGNVVLEAMALKCPVICLNHQGSAVMTDEGCAIRVEPGPWAATVGGFAGGLRRLQEDDSLVRTLGEGGRARILEHFTWDRKIEVMNGIYEQVMSGGLD